MRVVVHFDPAMERLASYLDRHEHHVRGNTGMTWRARVKRAFQVRLHRRFRAADCFQCQLREFYGAQIAELKAALARQNAGESIVTTGKAYLHTGERITPVNELDDPPES